MTDERLRLTPDTPLGEVTRLISLPVPGSVPDVWPLGWHEWENVKRAHADGLASLSAPKPTWWTDEDGVVMTVKRGRFADAYAACRVLRELGCALPVQLWYLGRNGDREAWMDPLAESVGATWADGDMYDCRMLNAWELEVLATVASPFGRVVSVTAVPRTAPGTLLSRLDVAASAPGMTAMDKRRAWPALRDALWMSDHSDFYYPSLGRHDVLSVALMRRGTVPATVDGDEIADSAEIVAASLAEATAAEAPFLEHKRRRQRWGAVRGAWSKATALAMAVASRGLASRKAEPEVKRLRWASCHGDAAAGRPPCKLREYSQDGRFHFCGACGCGEREVARLSAVGSPPDGPRADATYDKLDYPLLVCPIDMPGFYR